MSSPNLTNRYSQVHHVLKGKRTFSIEKSDEVLRRLQIDVLHLILPEELREAPRETGEKCEKCGEPMVLKKSRWGKDFLACSGYPNCKNTREPHRLRRLRSRLPEPT